MIVLLHHRFVWKVFTAVYGFMLLLDNISSQYIELDTMDPCFSKIRLSDSFVFLICTLYVGAADGADLLHLQIQLHICIHYIFALGFFSH